MFIKSLLIEASDNRIIREINFHKGLNLIVDDSKESITGNNVGKTTILKIIDYCLGAEMGIIYTDPENPKLEYKLVKDFLIKNKVIITLILIDCFENISNQVVIKRNFEKGKNAIRSINGINFSNEQSFEREGLLSAIFPAVNIDKPTFRQIISHNIRYSDHNISNTLKTLGKYSSYAEYETLILFLLGCDFKEGDAKQEIIAKLLAENTFKNRLEKEQSKNTYESALALIDNEIAVLQFKKAKLNINENLEANLNQLNYIRSKINTITNNISSLTLKRDIIEESEKELNQKRSNIDLSQLKTIYEQANSFIPDLQKTFEDLVAYHNQMIKQKSIFITKELPLINESILKQQNNLSELRIVETGLMRNVVNSDSYEDIENLSNKLFDLSRRQGEYQSIIYQIKDAENNIDILNSDLKQIEANLFSDGFEQIVKNQINKFNVIFSNISYQMYEESYAISYEVFINKNNQKLYKFDTFNMNMSSGKKQGEISCFDIAYTLFADENNIPCLHFLLNDKKELLYGSQLVKIQEVVEEHNNIQFIASILKDKLPQELNNESFFVVKLSQKDKLFRIENSKS